VQTSPAFERPVFCCFKSRDTLDQVHSPTVSGFHLLWSYPLSCCVATPGIHPSHGSPRIILVYVALSLFQRRSSDSDLFLCPYNPPFRPSSSLSMLLEVCILNFYFVRFTYPSRSDVTAGWHYFNGILSFFFPLFPFLLFLSVLIFRSPSSLSHLFLIVYVCQVLRLPFCPSSNRPSFAPAVCALFEEFNSNAPPSLLGTR